MRIYPLYDEIIIGVTTFTYGGRKKQVIDAWEVKHILEKVFQHLPKIRVTLIGEGFIERKQFEDLPKFDVVVTGNTETIRKLEKLGMKARYVRRSKGIPGWSGHELRNCLNWR